MVTYATITKAAAPGTPRRRFDFLPMTTANTVTIAAEDYEHVGAFSATTDASGAFTVQIPLGLDQNSAVVVWQILETPIDRISFRAGGPTSQRTVAFVNITASGDYDSLVAASIVPTTFTPDVTSNTVVSGYVTATGPTKDALAATFASYKNLARNPDLIITGAVTRDANGAATSAPVTWPDGSPGTYTATTVSTAFPGAIDAYTITYGSPVTKTYTQPLITRDASTGAATNVPAITVA